MSREPFMNKASGSKVIPFLFGVEPDEHGQVTAVEKKATFVIPR